MSVDPLVKKSTRSHRLKRRMLMASLSHISVVFFIVAFTMESQITGGVGLTVTRTFLDAIRYTESGGDVCALGDSGRSLGAYRIKREHFTDAVVVNGTLKANGEGTRICYTIILGIHKLQGFPRSASACLNVSNAMT